MIINEALTATDVWKEILSNKNLKFCVFMAGIDSCNIFLIGLCCFNFGT